MSHIVAKLNTGTTVELSNGRHTWLADEPVELGGADAGPNPYDLLLSALAACTCITLSMYCQRKGLELRSISANYEFDRVHAEDCGDCDDSNAGFIDQITSDVRIDGEFDDAQRKRLTQIVGRCPVHKTLAKKVVFLDQATFV